ncbi:MAG: LysM peptidoglycan-binding domain-containing protein [Rikenellaceae bacterium]
MHNGIDIKAYTGDNLYAVFDGTVRLAKYCSGYGYCVVIRHHNGLETLYAHASKLMVKPNDHVKAGDVVALAGNTGRSTGSHLHYEVRMLGHVIDPNLIIDTKNHTIQPKRLYLTMRSGRIIASNNDDEQQREAEILAAISIKYYVVRKGDVLSRIAQRNQTTVSTLCRLNGISSKSTLRIGQRLIVRDGVRTTTKSPQLTKSTIPSSGGAQYHTVKSGETLSSIARKYGTTITNICNINGISSRSIIRVGQRLKMK